MEDIQSKNVDNVDVDNVAVDNVAVDNAAIDKNVLVKKNKPQNNNRKRLKKINNYYTSMLTRKLTIGLKYVDSKIKQNLETIINNDFSGKCIIEGYVKKKSCELMTYSSGLINGENIIFDVVFKCLICNPVEGMLINCVVKNITKAGIRAEMNENPTSMIVFISRDHHIDNDLFSSVKVDDTINVKIIGKRFELNDKFISILGELKK